MGNIQKKLPAGERAPSCREFVESADYFLLKASSMALAAVLPAPMIRYFAEQREQSEDSELLRKIV